MQIGSKEYHNSIYREIKEVSVRNRVLGGREIIWKNAKSAAFLDFQGSGVKNSKQLKYFQKIKKYSARGCDELQHPETNSRLRHLVKLDLCYTGLKMSFHLRIKQTKRA